MCQFGSSQRARGAQAHINSGHPAVKWCIKVDPRGDRNHADYSFSHRCKHVSLVEKARAAPAPGLSLRRDARKASDSYALFRGF